MGIVLYILAETLTLYTIPKGVSGKLAGKKEKVKGESGKVIEKAYREAPCPTMPEPPTPQRKEKQKK